MTKASLVMLKAKQMDRVCYSSKDAESLVVNKLVEDAVFAARQIATLLYGDY